MQKGEEYQVPQFVFQGEQINILEFPIKYLFENTATDIEFIHKSIYEYFTAERVFVSMCRGVDLSKDKFAAILGAMLKQNRLSMEILEFLKYRIEHGHLKGRLDKITDTFELMMHDGMTYYTGECYRNPIERELIVFSNMLDILHLWKSYSLRINFKVSEYLRVGGN